MKKFDQAFYDLKIDCEKQKTFQQYAELYIKEKLFSMKITLIDSKKVYLQETCMKNPEFNQIMNAWQAKRIEHNFYVLDFEQDIEHPEMILLDSIFFNL